MKIGQRIMRFGIKKLSIGVVSVAVGFALWLQASFSRREKQENHQLCWWLTRLLASIYYGFKPVFLVEKNKKTTSYAGG
ncbi:YSIRK-type signal peptide-containing protein [Streptococcus pseudopneumoniae]|uniref:YSIRK-type signal peptide-containing protein n=1 Tax=Streptococcus pseudopneumoniae TaxID=257758 RepID=UPI00110C3ED1|nr:YSIRK-type signal peptide-containing protein [Streptococcus pseudopneumoniae]TMR76387.1 YSIRK-type signal peptide-containing protein [Streptococcus pseudopneumoniae]